MRLPLVFRLRAAGLRGEGRLQTWLVKSHWPERGQPLAIDDLLGVVLAVRSPFDAIESLWHMRATDSHERTDADARSAAAWAEHVANEARAWARFHRYWFDRGFVPGGSPKRGRVDAGRCGFVSTMPGGYPERRRGR